MTENFSEDFPWWMLDKTNFVGVHSVNFNGKFQSGSYSRLPVREDFPNVSSDAWTRQFFGETLWRNSREDWDGLSQRTSLGIINDTHLTIRPLRHFKNFVCSLDVRLRSFCFEAAPGLRAIHKGNFHIHTCKQKFFNVCLVVQRASKKMILPTRFCRRELLAEWTSYWEKFLLKRTCWENFPRTLSNENCSSWQIRQ